MTAMLTYRWMWRTVAGGLLLLAVILAVLILPAAIWMILASLAVPFGLMLAIGTDNSRSRRRHVVTVTVVGFLVAAGEVALIRLLGFGALAMFGVLLATSPPALRLYGVRVHDRKMPDATVGTRQLCRQWLDSYDELHQAPTAKARLRVVMARQRCLDELERRDPDGLQAWLFSSASAGSDPRRFLTDSN
ncbi:hypothetical protein [Kribbella sp. NPDC051137]|uniref:hypothetical protein n=1 Tax=Kribbella sp. NPDC051137 TaxID=3155045 RepID=UPI002F67CBAA